jgi:hypothetical protein
LPILFAALIVASPSPADRPQDAFDVPRLQLSPSLRGTIPTPSGPGRSFGANPFAFRSRRPVSRARQFLVLPAEPSAAGRSRHRDDEQGPVILELGTKGIKPLHCEGHLFHADQSATEPHREER